MTYVNAEYFGENLFDDFFNDFPFYDDNAGQKIEKKLYGRHGQNLMKTDIKGNGRWL